MGQVGPQEKDITGFKGTYIVPNETHAFAFCKEYELVFNVLVPGNFKVRGFVGPGHEGRVFGKWQLLNERLHNMEIWPISITLGSNQVFEQCRIVVYLLEIEA